MNMIKKKIGITGAHGVGKTTLLNVVAETKEFENTKIITGVQRWLKANFKIGISENGNYKSQKMIAANHSYNLIMYDNFITDRTPIDVLAYTIWMKNNGKVSYDGLVEIEEWTRKTYSLIDDYFYIPPEFDLVNDDIRPVEQKVQQEIDRIIKELLHKYDIPYYTLTGSTKNRFEMFGIYSS